MKQVQISVITTREDEISYMRDYTDYQNRYNAAFHNILHNIVTYNKAGLGIAAVVHMIQYTMSAYQIDEFNSDDWDLICNEFARRAWDSIPSV